MKKDTKNEKSMKRGGVSTKMRKRERDEKRKKRERLCVNTKVSFPT